jgi:cardiolipin synthase
MDSSLPTKDYRVTIASYISIARVVMVPVILYCMYQGRMVWALALFAVAAATDAIDGIVARLCDCRSHLGSILDPAADKILLTSSFCVLAISPYAHVPMPVAMAVLVVWRDVMIVLGVLVLLFYCSDLRFAPTWTSKATTFFQIVLALVVLAVNAFSTNPELPRWFETAFAALLALTAALTIFSFAEYCRIAIKLLESKE